MWGVYERYIASTVKSLISDYFFLFWSKKRSIKYCPLWFSRSCIKEWSVFKCWNLWEESLPDYIPTSVMVSLRFRNKQCFASYAAWKSSCFIETECSAWATELQIKAMNFDASRRAEFSYCMWFSLHSANGNKISLFLCSDVQVKGETSVHNEVHL